MISYQMKEKMINYCKMLHDKNMLAAADGNLSIRCDDTYILMTPSGVSKAFVRPEDLAVVTVDNQTIQGKPSSERLMHLKVYQSCEKAMAVVHAHPPTAIAWSVAFPELKELPNDCLSEVVLAAGSIPFVEYARPGTKDMGCVLEAYLPKHRALILSRHGALTWGESIDEAYRGMERIEHSAEILYRAQQLKGLTSLPKEEFEHLVKMRESMGERLL